MTAVLKTTENYIVLPVKAITVIAFGASLKFGLFPNSEIYLINKINLFKKLKEIDEPLYILHTYMYL